MLKMIKEEWKVHEWAPFFVCGLPTVCLPTELQAATSCKAHESRTSRHTKAELRVKAVKVKSLDLAVKLVMRLFELQRSNPDTCFICLGEFGKGFGQVDEDDERDFKFLDKISRQLDRIEKEKQN